MDPLESCYPGKPTWANALLHPPLLLSALPLLRPHSTHPPTPGSVMLCPDDDKVVLEMAGNGNGPALPQLS